MGKLKQLKRQKDELGYAVNAYALKSKKSATLFSLGYYLRLLFIMQ